MQRALHALAVAFMPSMVQRRLANAGGIGAV
jgi:hypothetical protein